MPPNQSPDPRASMWDFIAYYLRFCRVQRRLSGEELGRIMGVSKPTVSRIENGMKRLDETGAVAVDKAWNTGMLFTLMVWYATLGHDPQWFVQYVDKEQKAEVLKVFEAQVIPGLLQTEDYARVLLSGGMKANVEELLQERMARQVVLTKEEPVELQVLITEAAVEHPVGNPEIMRAQLARLLEVSEWRHVGIRVVPRTFEAGAHPGLDGSFSIMSGSYGDLVYATSPGGGRLVSTTTEVRSYAIRYDRIGLKALPEGPSRDLIRSKMEEYT
ncbi:helix-turn-helix transcriptional regulator [Actinomadura keratinilytica]|uniref:Helix-turn-helix transcriptional regulator n=2 Tax=Actinomadura keratinilytica TaxID=547461 RepID=A0ABP7YLW3_9ACTN